jgi:hypothetical protein
MADICHIHTLEQKRKIPSFLFSALHRSPANVNGIHTAQTGCIAHIRQRTVMFD